MDFKKFTIKAQETVQAAVSRVQSLGQQAIEPVHILSAIINVGEQVSMFLLHKTDASAHKNIVYIDYIKKIYNIP